MKTITFLALAAVIAAVGAPVRAQDERVAPEQRLTRPRPLETVLQTLTKNSGIPVVAESSLAGAQADYPRESATPQNLEALLDKVVKSLPPGTVWKKAMLPASTRFYRGDDVAAFLEIQTRMFGRATEKPGEPGIIEVLGQKLSQERATPVVATLGLKPVYVLLNTNNRRSADGITGANGQTDFSQILGNFSNMDPTARMKLMQQFGQMMQNMTPEQRRQMLGGGGSEGVGVIFSVPTRAIPPK